MATNTAEQDMKARREAREAEQKQVEENLKADREEMIQNNLKKMEQEAKYRPTPTIEEVQLAMAGQNKDIKDPDGSPEVNPNHKIVNPAQQIEVGREMPPAKSFADDEATRKAEEAKKTAAAKK